MKPEPITVTTVCSLCDQPWEDHGDKPSKDDCIRLLKAALAVRPPVAYTYTTPQWGYATGTTISGNVTSINRKDPPDDAVPAKVG